MHHKPGRMGVVDHSELAPVVLQEAWDIYCHSVRSRTPGNTGEGFSPSRRIRTQIAKEHGSTYAPDGLLNCKLPEQSHMP